MFAVNAQGLTSPPWLYVAFTSGSTEPSKGDTIWGDTSNANALLELVVLTSGTWGGGDAAGWMLLSNWNGTAWTSGENWTEGTTTPGNHGTFTSTPVDAHASPDQVRGDTPSLSFDASVNNAALLTGVMSPEYGGGGLTITVGVTSTTPTGDMSWGIALKSITDDVDVLVGSGSTPKAFAEPNYNTAVDAPVGAGRVKYFTITFTDGADMDSIAAGELFQLLLFRDAQDATNDDMAAAAQVIFVKVEETP